MIAGTPLGQPDDIAAHGVGGLGKATRAEAVTHNGGRNAPPWTEKRAYRC